MVGERLRRSRGLAPDWPGCDGRRLRGLGEHHRRDRARSRVPDPGSTLLHFQHGQRNDERDDLRWRRLLQRNGIRRRRHGHRRRGGQPGRRWRCPGGFRCRRRGRNRRRSRGRDSPCRWWPGGIHERQGRLRVPRSRRPSRRHIAVDSSCARLGMAKEETAFAASGPPSHVVNLVRADEGSRGPGPPFRAGAHLWEAPDRVSATHLVRRASTRRKRLLPGHMGRVCTTGRPGWKEARGT